MYDTHSEAGPLGGSSRVASELSPADRTAHMIRHENSPFALRDAATEPALQLADVTAT